MPALALHQQMATAMASIQSLGIGSGVLTSDLIDKIVAAERGATDTRMTAKKAELDAKISAFGAVKNTIGALQSAAQALGSSSSLLINTATSSDPSSVSATATSTAHGGVHTVEVSALARAHTIASRRFDDITSVVGTGTLNFSFGTTAFSQAGDYQSFTANAQRPAASVVIDASNDSLAGVRDAINSANIGVTANIVNDGAGYRLVVASDRLGAANSMQINVTEGTTPGLSALAFNASASTPDTNMTQTVAAQDAQATIDGIPVTRDSNAISGVVDGLTFDLQSINAGSPAVVTVAQDTAGIATKLSAFVSAYNDVRSLTGQLTAYNTDSKQGSLLTGDATILNVRTQLQRLLLTSVNGVGGGAVHSLVDLGVTSDQNNQYNLTLDPAKLTAALQKDPLGVQGLLAAQSSASDSLIDFAGFGTQTQAGSYAVRVTQLATHGSIAGQSLGAGAFPGITIGDSNDNLVVAIDGVTSGRIQLTQGSYATGAALAQEIQAKINADSVLQGAGVTATVTFNAADNHFEIASARYGSSSNVAVTSVDTSTTADLGFSVADGQPGADVAGTINGIGATGSGQFLSTPNGPQPATAGYFQGMTMAGFATPLTLDATNNSFSLRVDGVGSGTIVLAAGDYASGDALATEMQSKINADSALIAGGASVAVKYDAVSKRFTVTSATTGSNSSVAFSNVAAGAIASLGLGVGAGTAGQNAANAADPSAGISLKIAGGVVGDRGTVTLVRGVMNRIDQTLNDQLSFGGLFANKQSSLDAQEKDLADQQTAFDARMTALQTRLQTQFAAADALISQLNSTSSFLTQQLSALPIATPGSTSSSSKTGG
jgi:flagellar capping protein FliD